MVLLKHTGVYVDDIDKETCFYKAVFGMKPVSEKNHESNELLDELFGCQKVEILTTKLITEFGSQKKQGDMLELVKILNCGKAVSETHGKIGDTGRMHIAIGVDDIEEAFTKVKANGGKCMTKIYDMKNGRMCGFVTDPEGNWIEIIS